MTHTHTHKGFFLLIPTTPSLLTAIIMPGCAPVIPSGTFRCHTPTSFLLSISQLAVLCLLLISFLLQCGSSSAQPTSMSQVMITSVSGCSDIYPITVNCSMPANISIQTNGVGNLFTRQQYLQLTSSAGTRYATLYLNSSDPTNRTLWATVTPSVYNPLWMNTLVVVTLHSLTSKSAEYPGFIFAVEPVPVISSISGCTGSGMATTNCAPDSAVLTVHGTDIGWLGASLMQMRIGNNTMDSTLRVVNATYGTVSLADVYYVALFPEHYDGVMLPLQFQSSTTLPNGTNLVVLTNVLFVSFIPLPPPSIVSATVYSCDVSVSSGLSNHTGCQPGVTSVYFVGHYLYNLSATISNAPCVAIYNIATVFGCKPAVGAGLLPDVAYSLTLSNGMGSLTLPLFMAFTAQPSIAYVVPCIATLLYTATPSFYNDNAALCQPGAVLTIKGSQFPVEMQTVQANILVTSGAFTGIPFDIFCLSPAMVDSTTVTCNLPEIHNSTVASFIYGQSVWLRLGFNSPTVWTKPISTQLFQDPKAPIISGLSSNGCGSTTISASFPGSPLQVFDCVSNATLALKGSYLSSSSYYVSGMLFTAVLPPAFTTATVVFNSSTQLLLQLPDISDALSTVVTGLPYQFVVSMWNGPDYIESNVFLVSFASSLPSNDQASSSLLGLSLSALVGVVVAGVFAVIACTLLVWMILRRVRSQQAAGSGESGFRSFEHSHWQEDSGSNETMSGTELQRR